MNNSNECNGNHAMLVILFSVACPSAPPPNPPHHCKSRKTSSKSSAMFLISQLLYLCTIPSQKGGISDRVGTLIDPPQPCFISAPTHTHTHTSHVLYVFWPFYLARCVRTQLEVTLIGAVASLAGGIDRLRQ